jgi:hypothetical protein
MVLITVVLPVLPVICKVFEHCLMSVYEDILAVDDFQFGFKRCIGCTDAIFVFRSAIEDFDNHGSTVYTVELDIKC